MLRPPLPTRRTPWGLWASGTLWALLAAFVILTLWSGHPPLSLPPIPWGRILGRF